MAAIHDLLAQVQDEALRARLEQEINRLSKTKKFGLVFEEHLPECTPLYDIPVKRGSTVAKKTGAVSEMYEVSAIKDGIATCYHKVTAQMEEIPVDELVSVAQFGEPIYGSSANIRKSNIPCTLTLRLINLYYSGHTWYALPSSTCCLSPQQIRLIMDWQRNFRQHQDLFPGLPQNERVPLGLIFYNGQ